jgi:hypothetical protein
MSQWKDKGCPVCRSLWESGKQPLELAVNYSTHSRLHRCPSCGTYWEQNERYADTVDPPEVQMLYPGAFQTKVESLTEIGMNGEEITESMSNGERRKLYPPLGIVKIVRLRWNCDGRMLELELKHGDDRINYELLPDRSGFLITSWQSNGTTSAAIWNADLTIRFSLRNPWPGSPFYKPNQTYCFVWPTVELGQPGFVISVSPADPTEIAMTVDHFYVVDPDTGVFVSSHPLH